LAVGNTTTDALSDSLDVVVASARIVREFEGAMPNLVEKVSLDEGTGLSWKEVSFRKMQAQNVSEMQTLSNLQQLQDDDFVVTPTVSGVSWLITDRVAARLSKKAYAKIGGLGQNAIQRKKDQDGLVALDAGISLGAAGSALTPGHISAAAVRATSNVVEMGMGPLRCVLHGFQIKDIYDAVAQTPLITGNEAIGDYQARIFQDGYRGKIHGAQVYEDGNITIDADADAKGGLFPQNGIVLVQGRNLKRFTRQEPDVGGGATSFWLYDEYAYGERLAGGTTQAFVYELYSDATAPTS
jgi:hypothetical protein